MPKPRKAEILWREWRSLAPKGAVPQKADLDPTRLVPVLPDMLIYQLLEEPETWRFRLMGTRVAERIGVDATGGNPLELMHGDNRVLARDAFLRVIQEPVAHLSQVSDEYPDGKTSLIEVLRLPLRSADGTINVIVSVTEELEGAYDRLSKDRKPKLLAKPIKSAFFDLADEELPF